MIVVDTNVLAYLYLDGPRTKAAEDLLRRETEWAVPLLWRSEFRNLLIGQVRAGMLSFEKALEIQSAAETLLAGQEYSVNSSSVLSQARDSGCTAYDCEFAVLAMALGTRLVTEDRALLKAFPRHAVRLGAA